MENGKVPCRTFQSKFFILNYESWFLFKNYSLESDRTVLSRKLTISVIRGDIWIPYREFLDCLKFKNYPHNSFRQCSWIVKFWIAALQYSFKGLQFKEPREVFHFAFLLDSSIEHCCLSCRHPFFSKFGNCRPEKKNTATFYSFHSSRVEYLDLYCEIPDFFRPYSKLFSSKISDKPLSFTNNQKLDFPVTLSEQELPIFSTIGDFSVLFAF